MQRKAKAAYEEWRRTCPGALPWEALSDEGRASWRKRVAQATKRQTERVETTVEEE